jgi:hypothetical protein
MKLPFALFRQSVSEKRIYRFNLNYKGNSSAHYYLCVKTEEDYVWFMCCTSQRDSRVATILRDRGNLETLVQIAAPGQGPFTKDTFVDCNSAELIEWEEVEAMYNKNSFQFLETEIGDNEFRLVVKGILLSKHVEKRLQKLLSTCLNHIKNSS